MQPLAVSKQSYLHYLARRRIYGARNQFFKVKIAVPHIRIPPPRKFELFDITFYNPIRNPHTVYHALCVSNQDWTDFSFFQLTDMHIAKRNDAIFDTIAARKFAGVDLELPIADFFEKMDPEIFLNPRLRNCVEFLEFRSRANNFNIALRQVIAHAKRARSGGKTGLCPYVWRLGGFRENRRCAGAIFNRTVEFPIIARSTYWEVCIRATFSPLLYSTRQS